MLRLLHTSDWHLGQNLHELPRDSEHQAFLNWLLEQPQKHAVDALLIAGDIFDTANPPTRAMRMWFDFLRQARDRYPALDIVVIGGNHDSPARLEAAGPILEALRIFVVGAVPRREDGTLDAERMVVPLHDASGAVAAWCGAVPYLRPSDLPAQVTPGPLDNDDTMIAGVRAIYRAVTDAQRARAEPHHALVSMGHAYMVGTSVSELSERRILGGNQHALPADIFDEDLAYVALGHLHRAQRVGSRKHVRYCGSPIPLAIDEDTYPHQVVLATIPEQGPTEIEKLLVPRHIDIIRIPGREGAPFEEVEPRLRTLPEIGPDSDPSRWPLLEVRVTVDGPRPSLRREVDALIANKAVRLVRLSALRAGSGAALAQVAGGRELSEILPDEVLRSKWQRDYGSEPPPPVLACFHELLDQVGQNEGGAA